MKRHTQTFIALCAAGESMMKAGEGRDAEGEREGSELRQADEWGIEWRGERKQAAAWDGIDSRCVCDDCRKSCAFAALSGEIE